MNMTKKKTAMLTLALILCIGIVSAGLLSYYAKIETTVNVAQGILVDGQGYETPIEEIADAFGGRIVYTSHTIENLGDKEATVYLSWESNDSKGIDVTYFVNQATLTLENKVVKFGESNWAIIDDDTQAFLTYNLVGYTFDYKLLGFKLQPDTAYSLIYYADYDELNSRWGKSGGDNPGAFIGSATTDSKGNLLMEGNADLGIDLPSTPDANIKEYDYTELDGYVHAHGAKIWLVPSIDYDANTRKVTNWNDASNFLYETDLISYINLGVTEHYIHPDPISVTEITVPAHATISFVIRIDFAPEATGTYLVTTTVSP
jgi:hypothetical protein